MQDWHCWIFREEYLMIHMEPLQVGMLLSMIRVMVECSLGLWQCANFIEKTIDKLKKSKATNSQVKVKEEAEKSALERIQEALMGGKPSRSMPLTEFEKESINHLCLLTMKPVIYVANVAESDLASPENNPHVKNIMKLASELQSGIVTVSAQVKCGVLLLRKVQHNHNYVLEAHQDGEVDDQECDMRRNFQNTHLHLLIP